MIEFPQEQRLLFLGVSSFGDINEGANRPLKFAVAQHRTQPVLDREARAVAPAEDFTFHMGGLPRLGRPDNRRLVPRIGGPVVARGMDHGVEVLADHLLLALEAKHPHKGGVTERREALAIDAEDGVGGRIDQQT
jgi:hypothetical protein